MRSKAGVLACCVVSGILTTVMFWGFYTYNSLQVMEDVAIRQQWIGDSVESIEADRYGGMIVTNKRTLVFSQGKGLRHSITFVGHEYLLMERNGE